MAHLVDRAAIRDVLRRARVIAVLGAHTDRNRPAWRIPAYLAAQGYRMIPVNPRFLGTRIWGEPVVAKLADIPFPIDIIDVFRRRAHLSAHLPEILALHPQPGLVWLQSGIADPVFREALVRADLDVVEDRCLLVDHQRLEIGPV